MRILLLPLIAVLLLLSAGPGEPAAAPTTTTHCPPLTSVEKMRAWVAAQTSGKPTGDFPIGMRTDEFARLCGDRQATALLCTGGDGRQPSLDEVRSVDAALRARFEYRDDFIQTGRSDDWASRSVTCGDCEDYAISLAEDLHAAGVGGQHLRLVIWSPYADAGHATLIVDTTDAGEIEVGVGDIETPQPMDWAKGKRFATIRFDGQRTLKSQPGFWCEREGCVDLKRLTPPKP